MGRVSTRCSRSCSALFFVERVVAAGGRFLQIQKIPALGRLLVDHYGFELRINASRLLCIILFMYTNHHVKNMERNEKAIFIFLYMGCVNFF